MEAVAQIMAVIFGPGTLARSGVYRQGFEAVLTAHRNEKESALCPFKPGTVEHDAWFAGAGDAENFDDVNEGLMFDRPDDDEPFLFG